MRRLSLAVLVVCSMLGCGGGGDGGGGDGGGSSTSNTLASECVGYCAFACGKVVVCTGLPTSELASCNNACTAKIISDGTGTAQACEAARGVIDGATCGQIATLVGLPPANSLPVANAGPNQTVTIGMTVHLDGSRSSDANNDPLTFRWIFTSRPAGSTATLVNTTTPAPTFVPDIAGLYLVQLTVHDGKGESAPSSVAITATAPATPAPPPSVPCVGAPSGLVAWWSGDTTGRDTTDNQRDAVLTTGARAGSSGKVAGAFSFDGVGGQATTPVLLPLQGTIELWIHPLALSGAHGILGTVGTANGEDRLWIIVTGALGGPGIGPHRLVVNLGSRTANNIDIPNPLTVGTWTHVALVFDYLADVYGLYINGRVATTSTAMRNPPTQLLQFGAVTSDFGQQFFFQGLLDEITLYTRVLNATEVVAIAQAEGAGKCK